MRSDSLAQLVEHNTFNVGVLGSIEHLTLNQRVLGSSPRGSTSKSTCSDVAGAFCFQAALARAGRGKEWETGAGTGTTSGASRIFTIN